jgi:hypothetical protein
MTKADDEFGKQILSPLKSTPPIDPQVAAGEKTRFLILAENLRKGFITNNRVLEKEQKVGLPSMLGRIQPMLRGLVAILIALIVLLGSSLTVYAAQSSLPGEALYPVKSLSENIHLSLTRSPHARLELILKFSQRRVGEISQLLAKGESIPSQVSESFQDELENALQIAMQMDDIQMLKALEKIKGQAESQGRSIDKLFAHLTEQNEPALVRLQERLREQVMLSEFGESDPQNFRNEIRERQHRRDEARKSTPNHFDTVTTPKGSSITPLPSQAGDVREDANSQPTQAPDQDNGAPGQGNPDPGNGNHGPDPSRTPKP